MNADIWIRSTLLSNRVLPRTILDSVNHPSSRSQQSARPCRIIRHHCEDRAPRAQPKKGREAPCGEKKPERVDFDSLLRHRLAKDGYTEKELKTLEWARRYLVTIEKQQEKDRRSFLKGPFTDEEMDILKIMYEDGIHLRIIADRLGRKEPLVKAKIKSLAPYFQNRNEPLPFHDLQVLAPELEDSIFHACQRSGKD
jgi:DNA-binding CsgD family transcriptional regulator